MYKKIENPFTCFAGYSNNKDIRYHGSSGGIVTEILLFLLKEKIINGALVSKMKEKLKTETILAKTEEEIRACQGSLYIPVPFISGLKKLLEENGRFAIVGLPCHFKILENDFPQLKLKIFLKIGLFCRRTPALKATESLLKKENMSKEDLIYLRYRGLGRIGFFIARTKNKEIKKSSRQAWNELNSRPEYFTKNCIECKDHFASLSDISCGDAWLREYGDDPFGTSLMISYNNISKEILMKMSKQKLIYLEELSFNKVLQSQGYETFNNNG